jgi:hypothetical protein
MTRFNTLFALQWTGSTVGVVMVVVLMLLLIVPFLIKANRDGKRQLGPFRHLRRGGGVELGPSPPIGAGDNNPGRVGDPAPGMPDGQADPWGPRAQREAPPIKS